MMNSTFVAISVVFTVFALVLAWNFVQGGDYSPSRLAVKLGLSSVLVFLSIALAFSFGSYQGYASDNKVPNRTILKSIVISEPDGNWPGAFYIWGISPPKEKKAFWKIFVYEPRPSEPRAHILPYSKEKHKQMQEAAEAIKDGKLVTMDSEGDAKSGGNSKGKAGQGQENSSGKLVTNGNGQAARKLKKGEKWTEDYQITVEDPRNLLPKDPE